MTVNHDVVGSSPTGGVIRHLKFNDLSFFIYLKNKGSIISVVGKTTIGIMEPILF